MGHVGEVLGFEPTPAKAARYSLRRRARRPYSPLPNAVVRLGGMMRRLAAFDCGSAPAARGLHRD